MQFTTFVLAVLSVAGTTLAADCSGSKQGKPDLGLYWTAREVACNSGNSAYSDGRVEISYVGNKPNTKLCWDSTENIIQQCIAEGWQFGYYNYDGATIKVVRK